MNKILTWFKSEDKYILFIYLYVLLMPWNFEKWQMGALTVILFTWWIIKYRKKTIQMTYEMFQFKPMMFLFLWLAFMYLSIFWSESYKEALSHLNKFYKYYFLMIPVIFTSLNKEQAKSAIKLLFISFALYAIFSIMIYLGLFIIEETRSTQNNPKGIMAYAIVSVYFAIGTLCFFILSAYSKNKAIKLLFISLGVICLFALLINKGRTAQVGLVLSVITLFIIYIRNINIKYIFIGVFISILIAFFVYDNTTIQKRYMAVSKQITKLIDKNVYSGSLGARIYFYKAAKDILKNNWLIGTGAGDNIHELIKQQYCDNFPSGRLYRSFHSQHLDTLTRYGIVGYLLLIVSIVWLLYRLRKNREYFMIGLSFFLVTFYSSLANVMLLKKPFNYIFILFFTLVSIIAYQTKDKLEKKECK